MRKHLLAQLENETMTPFPQQTKQVKRGKEVTHHFPLYSKCRVPFFEDDPKEDKGFFMAFCSVCGEWYHKRCENIPLPFFETKKKLLYGNARNVNKSRNMKLPFTDEEWHTLETKNGSFKSHTYMKNYFGQF